jgi:hypothetical protein
MDTAFQWVIDNGGIDTERDYKYSATEGTCSVNREDREVVTIDSYANGLAPCPPLLALAAGFSGHRCAAFRWSSRVELHEPPSFGPFATKPPLATIQTSVMQCQRRTSARSSRRWRTSLSQRRSKQTSAPSSTTVEACSPAIAALSWTMAF